MDDSLMSDDENWDGSEEEEEEFVDGDHELLPKLLNHDIDNEETLFALVVGEQVPALVLNQAHIEDDRFDYIIGILNLTRRLLRIHDEVIDQWLGIDNGSEIISIFSFVFSIIDQYFERISLPEMTDFDTPGLVM